MTMEGAKPFQITPSSSLDSGPQKSDNDDKTPRILTVEVKKGQVVEGSYKSPSMNMCLGICADTLVTNQRNPLITEAQLHELEQQGLIFKYLVAGLPVPLSLLKSVAPSFGSTIGDRYLQFPSPVRFYRQEFERRNMMDQQPERCRRTDGKKWRCGNNVIPAQKYCERHMHRGRQRSTKPVKGSHIPPPDKTPYNCSISNPEDLTTNHILGNPILKTESMDTNTSTSPCTVSGNADAKASVVTITTMTSGAVTGHEDTRTNEIPRAIHADATAGTSTACNKKCSRIRINERQIDAGKSNCSGSVSCKSISNRKFVKNGGSNAYQAPEFSPKSVLQVQGTRASYLHQSDAELEPARCRRTDGKKWRCRRDALSNQKYCGAHMHRGAKKHEEASQPPTFPSAAWDKSLASTSSHQYPIETLRKREKGDCADLNTDLSMSILASPRLGANDDATTSSSSSATTISDTLIAT